MNVPNIFKKLLDWFTPSNKKATTSNPETAFRNSKENATPSKKHANTKPKYYNKAKRKPIQAGSKNKSTSS